MDRIVRDFRIALACALAALTAPALAADVGVSVSVGQPGFYGRIDIGNAPQPQVIYAEPVVIHRPRPTVVMPPALYLHVPPGHAKNWAKHCAKYQACGRPVYFVQERWYSDVYAPHYRERGGHPGKGRKGHKND